MAAATEAGEVAETSSEQAVETIAVVVEANITIQEHPEIQIVSRESQCAVCQKCFPSQSEVIKHLEIHGNAETAIGKICIKL